MELTKEQIQKIEHYLNTKKITYVDVRLEVLDHIICDIERLMIENNSFENAFKKVTHKWNYQFKEDSSMYFGIAFSAPKIILKKAERVYKKFYIFSFASYFLPLLISYYFNINILNPNNSPLFVVPKSIVILFVIIFLWMFFKKDNQIKTTYSFILKTQSLGFFIGSIVMIVFLNNPKELNGIHIGMLSTFIFSTYCYFYFYKKHKIAIQRFKVL